MAPGHTANRIEDKLRRCAAIIESFAFGGLLSACASSQTQQGATVSISSPRADKAFVRKVDFSGAPEMRELAERARRIGNEMYPRVLALLADDTYFGQPAGSLTEEAVEFLNSLDERGQLPGILKGDHEGASVTIEMSQEVFSSAYPVSRTFYLSKKGDPALYYYLVLRTSEDSAWKLQKAWRTGSDGRVIEEYSVP